MEKKIAHVESSCQTAPCDIRCSYTFSFNGLTLSMASVQIGCWRCLLTDWTRWTRYPCYYAQKFSDRENPVWILLPVASALLNAIAEWRPQSGDQALKIGFARSTLMPQLFNNNASDGTVDIALGKIVDDLLLTEHSNDTNSVIARNHERFLPEPSFIALIVFEFLYWTSYSLTVCPSPSTENTRLHHSSYVRYPVSAIVKSSLR